MATSSRPGWLTPRNSGGKREIGRETRRRYRSHVLAGVLSSGLALLTVGCGSPGTSESHLEGLLSLDCGRAGEGRARNVKPEECTGWAEKLSMKTTVL